MFVFQKRRHKNNRKWSSLLATKGKDLHSSIEAAVHKTGFSAYGLTGTGKSCQYAFNSLALSRKYLKIIKIGQKLQPGEQFQYFKPDFLNRLICNFGFFWLRTIYIKRSVLRALVRLPRWPTAFKM